MSMNHIVKGGLKDLALDVKSLSIQGQIVNPGSGGSGDVIGPANSADNSVTFFDGTTGKVIKEVSTIKYIPGQNVLDVPDLSTSLTTSLNADLQKLSNISSAVQTPVPITTLTGELDVGTVNCDTVNCDTVIRTPEVNFGSSTPGTIKSGGNLTLNNIGGDFKINTDVVIINSNAGIDMENSLLGIFMGNNFIKTTKTTFDNNELITKQFVDDAILPLRKTVRLFNQGQDYLVVNGGFYTDGNITLGWDATSQTEFLVNTLPATGGVTVSTLIGGTASNIQATQVNARYDIGGAVLLNGMLQSWVHANTDASYPNYYITIMKVGGSENSILTVEKY